MLLRLLLLVALLCPSLASAAVDCVALAASMERRLGVPDGLLRAIALAESGRRDHGSGRFVPWPWAIASGSDFSHFAEDKLEAIETVKRLQASGRRNIDVGCMQVNLLHHPDAFSTLERAFEPRANVEYGAKFLAALQAETGSWERAVERYHSADPVRGRDYRERVMDRWEALDGGEARPAKPRRLPAVYRPKVDRAARQTAPFAWAMPRWRLAPQRIGESLWTNQPARPLDLRRHIKVLPQQAASAAGATERP